MTSRHTDTAGALEAVARAPSAADPVEPTDVRERFTRNRCCAHCGTTRWASPAGCF